MEALITKEHLSTISMSWNWILSNGKSLSRKDPPHSREEDISLPCWPRKTKWSSSEGGILCCSSTISLSMILKPKLGLILNSTMKSPSGISEESWPPAFPHGNTLCSEDLRETFSREAIVQEVSTRIQFGT